MRKKIVFLNNLTFILFIIFSFPSQSAITSPAVTNCVEGSCTLFAESRLANVPTAISGSINYGQTFNLTYSLTANVPVTTYTTYSSANWIITVYFNNQYIDQLSLVDYNYFKLVFTPANSGNYTFNFALGLNSNFNGNMIFFVEQFTSQTTITAHLNGNNTFNFVGQASYVPSSFFYLSLNKTFSSINLHVSGHIQFKDVYLYAKSIFDSTTGVNWSDQTLNYTSSVSILPPGGYYPAFDLSGNILMPYTDSVAVYSNHNSDLQDQDLTIPVNYSSFETGFYYGPHYHVLELIASAGSGDVTITINETNSTSSTTPTQSTTTSVSTSLSNSNTITQSSNDSTISQSSLSSVPTSDSFTWLLAIPALFLGDFYLRRKKNN